ncbi:hypothetical protein D3C72_1287860 [compost metagenome]
MVVRVKRHRGSGQPVRRPDLHRGGAARRAVIGDASREFRQGAHRDRVHEAQLPRAADRARASRVKSEFPACVVRARADPQVDPALLDEAPDARVGGAVQRRAIGQVGTARHDEQHRVIEERCVMPDVIGHDRADLVCIGTKLLPDRPHQARGAVGGAGIDIGQDMGL